MSLDAGFAAVLAAQNIVLDAVLSRACAKFFDHEGVRWDDSGHLTATGKIDDPKDTGGATNFGISLKLAHSLGYLDINHDGAIDARDIEGLHLSDAIAVIDREFWTPYRYGDLPAYIAIKLLDLAGNMGPAPAH